MSRPINVPRLFLEILAAIALSETLVMFALPWLAPSVDGSAEVVLDAALLSLLAGPLVYWRVLCATRSEDAALAGHGRARRGVLLATGAVLFVGLGIAALAVRESRRQIESDARGQFERLSERLSRETERRVNLAVDGLRGALGVWAASKSVERLEFRACVAARDLPREFPGVLGFGFVQRVARGDLAGFELAERADDAPGFRVQTGGDAPEMFVAKFLEPHEPNRGAWGADLGCDPARRSALLRAVRSGEPTLSAPVALLEDPEQRAGLLYLLPIYRKGPVPATPEEREAALVGLVYAPVLLEDVLAGVTGDAEEKLDLEVFDGSQLATAQLLFDADGEPVAAKDAGPGSVFGGRMLHEVRRLSVGGREWSLALSTTPRFEASVARSGPLLIGAMGTLLCVLLASLVWSLGQGRVRALALAREMTADLAAAKGRAEESLRDLEALRQTIDAHSIVSVTDRSGRILDANHEFCRISGYTSEELLGQDHRLVNSGRHPPGFWAGVWRSISSGEPWRGEVCNRAKDGSHYWVDAIIAPFRGADGRIEKYISIRNDITRRKQAEAEQSAALALTTALARAGDVVEAARAINDSLHETTGLARTAVLLYGPDGVCRFAGWRGLSEAYRAAVEGHCPWPQGARDAEPIVIGDARTDAGLAAFRELFAREDIATLAFVPIQTESGVVGKLMLYGSQPGTLTSTRVHTARGAAALLGGAVARLRMAEALATNERRFRSLVEGTDVIAWEFDTRCGVFTYVSPQAARLGYPLEAWREPGFWASHLHPEDRDEAVRYCASETNAGRNHRFQYRMLSADGRVVWIEDFVSVEKSASGHVLERGVLIDITESKQVAQDLNEARARAEAATRTKSEFLANMSHEIRTPLTAILGFSDLLREDGDLARAPERRIELIDTIRNAGQYLLTVINDVLDLSKIEAGKMTIERVDTSLPQVLREVEDLVRPRALEKGLCLRTRLAGSLPDPVLIDPTRLRQILVNLVGNAVKFTAAGTIEIVASEADGRLRIDVEDTGPGLAPQEVQRLFQVFSQADASVTRKHGGTGLGLAISRRLAELMGGAVRLAWTEPGRGSRFQVDLPLTPAADARRVDSLERDARTAEPAAPLPAPVLVGRILLAEDGRDNQRLVSLHLRRCGAEVDIAENGRIALERIEQAEAEGRPYDLLVSDMQMPEMDGYTLARTLRERGSTLAIVALTAHAMAEDRARCESAGCDDYATKPIDRQALLASCARWMGKPGGAGAVVRATQR